MIPPAAIRVLESPSLEASRSLLDDEPVFFWVDWREEDDAIADYCEEILETGSLSAEVVEIEDDPGFAMYLSYGDRRVRVPLIVGAEDRHITLLTLNQILAPDYEIRVCVASGGGDTLAFLPLASSDWAELDRRYGSRVEDHFAKIREKPNLFTDPW